MLARVIISASICRHAFLPRVLTAPPRRVVARNADDKERGVLGLIHRVHPRVRDILPRYEGYQSSCSACYLCNARVRPELARSSPSLLLFLFPSLYPFLPFFLFTLAPSGVLAPSSSPVSYVLLLLQLLPLFLLHPPPTVVLRVTQIRAIIIPRVGPARPPD